ncbi:MAG: valine--tRNA ligase [Candidatus Woesearchaeota archaeon]
MAKDNISKEKESKDNKNNQKEDLSKNYNFKIDEPVLQQFWIDKGIYKFDSDDTEREIYSIDTPPPTISGNMHIGHTFSYAQEDFIARFQRMQGKNVFYPFGTDDNGLPTDKLVEKRNNVRSTQMNRTEYIKLCLQTLETIRPDFIKDWKNIGMSCDWDIYYSTINDHSRRLSQKSFIDLYKQGREYQKEAPTIWCPKCQTAIAQVELVDKEIASKFLDIIFKVETEDLVIATTRPEMLGSCVAVFAHPDDERYKKFIGKKARVPLFNHIVPILADERADPEKGTGIVMCCTFGDQTDIEWYKAHNLPLKMSIGKDGHMTDVAGRYKGLKIKEARAQIIDDLKDAGLLIKEKPISHTVNVHERCSTEIEILNSKQWFIKYLDIKEDFLKCGKEMTWYPQFMVHRYNNWIEGLQWDWCISRQRHFGVPFPVWYCKECGAVKVAEEDQLPVDPLVDKPKGKCGAKIKIKENDNKNNKTTEKKCSCKEFIPEKDVLDTWATSSLSPNLAVELMKGKPCYSKLYPMSLRPQAHDIITFWLFNTVVKSHLHYDRKPWENIMISGWALDPKGKKMSKSLGNVVEPRPVLEKYGADCLRFWAAGSKLGDDLPYQEKDLVTGKKMVNKLWNASKFAIMHLQDYGVNDSNKSKDSSEQAHPSQQVHLEKENLELIDKWLLSKLHKLIKLSTESFEKYEYSKAKLATEKFFWHTLCDNYLEIVKDRLYNPDKRGENGKHKRVSAQFTLYTAFLDVLKLMAPIMPHITEAAYHLYWKDKENEIESIHISRWPVYNENFIDELAEETGDKAVAIVGSVRKYKSEKSLSLKTELARLIIECDEKTRKELEFVEEDLLAVCKADKLDFESKGDIEASENIKIGVEIKEMKE